MKTVLKFILFIVLIILGYFLFKVFVQNPRSANTVAFSQVTYTNNEYRFKFGLPKDWEGGTVTTDKWTGYALNSDASDVAFANGPMILIHNPKWSFGSSNYQDIPIIVFTTSQWSDLEQRKFHVAASTVAPTELGANSKYVFALPAKYNSAHLEGYEEVDQIIQARTLTTF